MKNRFLPLSLLSVILFSLILWSCNKDDDDDTVTPTDTTNPVLSLNGNAIEYYDLGDTYVEAGATANDETDGNITSQIVISGTVNTNEAGLYDLVYSVSDQGGNTVSETRHVYVKADRLEGTYAVTSTVTGPGSGTYNYTETVTSTAVYNHLTIAGLGGYAGISIDAIADGNDVDFNESVIYDANGDSNNDSIIARTISSSYSVENTGGNIIAKILTINYKFHYFIGDGTGNYTDGGEDLVSATYTKQ